MSQRENPRKKTSDGAAGRKKSRQKKYIKQTLWEAAAVGMSVFAAGCLLWSAAAPPRRNASALVYFTNKIETEISGAAEIDYTPRKVALLRQCATGSEALETAVSFTSLSVSELTEYLTVERFGNSDGAMIVLSGLPDRSEAPLILGTLINYVQKSFDSEELKVISFCDIERQPGFPFVETSLSAGIAAGGIYFLILRKIRADRHARKATKRTAEGAHYKHAATGGDSRPEQSRPPRIPEKRYIETAMLKAVSLGRTNSTAPEGLEKSGYIHAARVLMENTLGNAVPIETVTRSKTPVIAICAAHGENVPAKAPPVQDEMAGHTAAVSKGLVPMQTTPPAPKREIPLDSTFASYLSCALASLGCRTALIECDLTKPVIGKIFRKAGAGGLADMAAGRCTIWEALLPNARKGVDIICDSKPYPAPAAIFSAPFFGGLIKYLSSQYDMILLHTPKGWDCPEWELIYRHCTGVAAVAKDGETPDKTCAMGILDAKGRFTALASVADVTTPEPVAEETARDNKAVKSVKAIKSANKEAPVKKGLFRRGRDIKKATLPASPAAGKKLSPENTVPGPPADVIRVAVPEVKRQPPKVRR